MTVPFRHMTVTHLLEALLLALADERLRVIALRREGPLGVLKHGARWAHAEGVSQCSERPRGVRWGARARVVGRARAVGEGALRGGSGSGSGWRLQGGAEGVLCDVVDGVELGVDALKREGLEQLVLHRRDLPLQLLLVTRLSRVGLLQVLHDAALLREHLWRGTGR